MRLKFNLCFITLVMLFLSPLYGGQKKIEQKNIKAVTYDLGGGRFGDQMIGYLHAKWISYYYDLPLLFKPFQYSEQLVLHYKEKHFIEKHLVKFKNIVHPKYQMTVDYKKKESALFVIPYFPECMWEHTPEEKYYYISVDWNDPRFRKELKKIIRPIDGFKPFIELPEDRVTVAVHVRRGGGVDDEATARKIPLKLPPDSYYIEQIQRMYEIFNSQPLYVYVFTDEEKPLEIVDTYRSYFAEMDIVFDCRIEGNNHHSNVLDDFFEMTRFDCLIRPDSNYSIVASKIADYKVIISPVHAIKNEDMIYVDEILVTYPPNL